MDKFTVLKGLAAPLDRVNVDTDQIIPKQYLKTIKRTGLREGLFSDWRYTSSGETDTSFFYEPAALPECRHPGRR
jgi:3-isopropylmalate/(R)-2-methylmalate dehydratase small subunit